MSLVSMTNAKMWAVAALELVLGWLLDQEPIRLHSENLDEEP
jgi:hypothetical protein